MQGHSDINIENINQLLSFMETELAEIESRQKKEGLKDDFLERLVQGVKNVDLDALNLAVCPYEQIMDRLVNCCDLLTSMLSSCENTLHLKAIGKAIERIDRKVAPRGQYSDEAHLAMIAFYQEADDQYAALAEEDEDEDEDETVRDSTCFDHFIAGIHFFSLEKLKDIDKEYCLRGWQKIDLFLFKEELNFENVLNQSHRLLLQFLSEVESPWFVKGREVYLGLLSLAFYKTGEAYHSLFLTERAQECHQQAVQITERINEVSAYIVSYEFALAQDCDKNNQFEKARLHYEKAINAALILLPRFLDDSKSLSKIFQTLAACYQGLSGTYYAFTSHHHLYQLLAQTLCSIPTLPRKDSYKDFLKGIEEIMKDENKLSRPPTSACLISFMELLKTVCLHSTHSISQSLLAKALQKPANLDILDQHIASLKAFEIRQRRLTTLLEHHPNVTAALLIENKGLKERIEKLETEVRRLKGEITPLSKEPGQPEITDFFKKRERSAEKEKMPSPSQW